MGEQVKPARRAFDVRGFVTTVGELAGAAAVTVGAAMIYAPAGWITGGVAAIVFSFQAAR